VRIRVDDLGDGLHRVRLALPWSGLDHVYCYALAGSPGWTLVDAGLGVTAAANSWRDALDQLGRPPVAQVVITHYHVDHAGAGADLQQLTGCDVVQTAVDAVQARSWHDPQAAEHQRRHLASHGCPVDVVEAIAEAMRDLARHVHIAPPTRLVTDGDLILGAGEAWRVVALPGHADGQIGLYATRSGRLLCADAILAGVAPYVGVHAVSRPDPLADQLATLDRLTRLAPRACYAAHHDPIGDVAGRAGQLKAHHDQLLAAHRDALAAGPQHAYGVSLRVYGQTMGAVGRRIAVVEALAHLTHLERRGEAERETGADGRVRFRLVRR
jgi:glyoxylase-like metal-dependent hydrolase (beta-lactamase superfamily II)